MLELSLCMRWTWNFFVVKRVSPLWKLLSACCCKTHRDNLVLTKWTKSCQILVYLNSRNVEIPLQKTPWLATPLFCTMVSYPIYKHKLNCFSSRPSIMYFLIASNPRWLIAQFIQIFHLLMQKIDHGGSLDKNTKCHN